MTDRTITSLRSRIPFRPSSPHSIFGALSLAMILIVTACSQMPGTSDAPSGAISITDVVGRSVVVKAPVERMILGEGRIIYLVSLLEKDSPLKRVVGWAEDLRTADLDTYNKYRDKFSNLTQIHEFGTIASGAFSAEKAIELKPDVLVLSVDTYNPARESGLIDKLERAGIPSVVVDFRQQPLENTVPSTYLLGRLMGKQDEAQRFVDFYLREVNKVHARLEIIKGPLPSVFLHRAPGLLECCATFGRANLGMLIERAGGINLGSARIPGWAGTMNPEQVLTSDPEVIIATGSNWSQSSSKRPDLGFVSLGYSARGDEARSQLLRLTEQPGWGNLQAVRNRRFHAVWHQFYNSPYHFAVLQQFAKWLHPDLFTDLEPERTLREFHDNFLPIPYSGTFWISLGN